ncbi:retinal rod rhodopsin-sensitive cGMP 3',5'-cyclic phosphodiesterase subunit delta-like [Aphis craccivora]|uniref:Retinal rod rhodopsin-sensitive cGMP 3',5'-cyclic phosphodiesterase subunit delta-like n=1 Tax=Aphis craccivora TaxID=307492 RepID=A0A6G0ZC06_APHCR|nr:retinal rod rhodopsin-sensitive cGMP 3',5'-cyclic phosphodiesterase subunit delta-like [Aphis craccivora]
MNDLLCTMPRIPEELPYGFHINWINLVDNDTGEVLWHTNDNYAISGNKFNTITVKIPRKVLDCKALTRTISFTSTHRIDYLKMRHRELVSLQCVHEWVSEFGTVLPDLNETWETTFTHKEGISSSSANCLSGDLVMETSFYNGDKFIGSTKILLYFQ